uniref:EF-hand domain-containing protein n=1 Tax=Guillardia theta TaxID=55529 RepID=A0A6U6BJL2_GUITH|mmetsp:Transcript_38671/g.121838  ORF Transcript_38671/g.121838 Transcript_38671/m.121838 type:complete len:655 (+) Transcript_38671:750-2714(+)
MEDSEIAESYDDEEFYAEEVQEDQWLGKETSPLAWGAEDLQSYILDNYGKWTTASKVEGGREQGKGDKASSRPEHVSALPLRKLPASCRSQSEPLASIRKDYLTHVSGHRPQLSRPKTARSQPPLSARTPSQSSAMSQTMRRPLTARTLTHQTVASSSSKPRKVNKKLECGHLLPNCWSPLPGVKEERDMLGILRQAESMTGMKVPTGKQALLKNPELLQAYSTSRKQLQLAPADQLSSDSSDSETESEAASKPSEPVDNSSGQIREKATEKLLGIHVLKADLVCNETRVQYSKQYFQRYPKLLAEENLDKRVGVVVGWDSNAQTTIVKWEDGTIEYCCTGFSKLFFLKLAEEKEEEEQSEVDTSEKIAHLLRLPRWQIAERGSDKGIARLVKDGLRAQKVRGIQDELQRMRRVQKLVLKENPRSEKSSKFRSRLLSTQQDFLRTLDDQSAMGSWIVVSANGSEVEIPPSSLTPTMMAAFSRSKVSLLDEVRNVVQRDTVLANRRQKAEEQGEQLKKKRGRRHPLAGESDPMDVNQMIKYNTSKFKIPLKSLMKSRVEDLEVVFHSVFQFFDFTRSGAISLIDFERAMTMIGVPGLKNNSHVWMKKKVDPKQREIDYETFKSMTVKLIEAARDGKPMAKTPSDAAASPAWTARS